MKIGFFEMHDWEEDFIRQRMAGHEAFFLKEPLTAANAKKACDCEIISVFIYSKIDGSILDMMPNLKMIATRSTGFDHIDMELCKKKDVMVCNVPSYGENTVAEHTFALILSLSRNIHKSYVRTVRGDFSIEGLKGFDLKGKTIGVVGAGKIGLHVIKIAKGFGMEVLAFDVNKNTFLEEVMGFKYVLLDELLSRSDIISLNVPYNKYTHHMINKDTIRKIKRGSILINTSRGKVIDTDALLLALESGIIAGAGLDVMEDEELIKDEKQILHDMTMAEERSRIIKSQGIFQMDNVVFTPHIAFYSQEALERILETTINNISDFCEKKPCNVVKSEVISEP